MSTQIFGALVALVVGALAPLVILPVLRRWQVIDVASARSSHTGVAVRALGLAPLAAVVVAGLATAVSLDPRPAAVLLVCLLGAAVIGIVGLVEDTRGLPIAARVALQWSLATAASCALLTISGVAAIPTIALGLLAGFLVSAYVNVANFMDGVDGLSAGHGVVTGSAFVILGAIAGSSALSAGGAILTAAMLGFMPWNLGPAKRFLGDVGSYLLGAMVALLAIAGLLAGLPLISVLAPVAIYGADTSITLLRRILRGARWHESHREHIYQRLAAKLTHPAVAAVVAILGAASALSGVLVATGAWPWWLATVVSATLALVYIGLPGALGLEDTRWQLARLVAPEPYSTRSMESHRAIVVGASGFVGSAVTASFRTHGIPVSELPAPRVATAARTLDELAGELTGDAWSLESLTESLEGVDVIVLAAGVASPDNDGDDVLYGANSLLPCLVARAADRAGVRRLVHVSSAAVQGRAGLLDESWRVNPFSAYSHSKALGEAALAAIMQEFTDGEKHVDIVIARATSVQGAGRSTTQKLSRLAQSRFSSVAAPGNQPTVVSTSHGLAEFIRNLALATGPMQGVRLQPWECHDVSTALEALSGRSPIILPQALCRAIVSTAFGLGQIIPRVAGPARRLEMLWFGQRQSATWQYEVSSRDWLAKER